MVEMEPSELWCRNLSRKFKRQVLRKLYAAALMRKLFNRLKSARLSNPSAPKHAEKVTLARMQASAGSRIPSEAGVIGCRSRRDLKNNGLLII